MKKDGNNTANTRSIDIGERDLDIYVDGTLVLHIGQVSDKDSINLWLYNKSGIEVCEPVEPQSEYFQELIMDRPDGYYYQHKS